MARANIQSLTLPDGKVAYGIEVPFTVTDEQWSEYELSDGNTLRMRNAAVKVFKVVDENGNSLYSPQGGLLYFVNATSVISASNPEQDDSASEWSEAERAELRRRYKEMHEHPPTAEFLRNAPDLLDPDFG